MYGKDVGEVTTDRVYPSGMAPSPADSFALPRSPTSTSVSLRGNAVVRWEWRPGSTMYFAWQQTRSGGGGVGDFEFGRDTRALFGTKPTNVYLVKLSYWLNP